MRHTAAVALCVIVLSGFALAQDSDSMFKPKRPMPPGTTKIKELQAETDKLRLRASQIGGRAEEMWDRGRYDDADKLGEEAEHLREQERQIEARVRWLEMHPGVPEQKSPLSGE
jgi:hypothetical protein